MIKQQLINDLNKLGFPLMEIEEQVDANKVLSEVVKSRDYRLWEGFPVLLANTLKKSQFDYENIIAKLKNKEDKDSFHILLFISLALFNYKHLRFNWSKQLQNNLSESDKIKLKNFRNYLAHDLDFKIGNKKFSATRFLDIFNNYFKQDYKESTKVKDKYEELSLEYALSQIFSPKQKELFKKKLSGDVFTKTEKEYFSRTVKKKVQALANPELHRLAQTLMEY